MCKLGTLERRLEERIPGAIAGAVDHGPVATIRVKILHTPHGAVEVTRLVAHTAESMMQVENDIVEFFEKVLK